MKKFSLLIICLCYIAFAFAQSDTSSRYAELKNLIVNETEPGGKYDFFTPIKGHEYESVQIKQKLFDTKIGLALIVWGKLNRQLGIKTLDDAYAIFAAYKAREINSREKEYIKLGFNGVLEN